MQNNDRNLTNSTVLSWVIGLMFTGALSWGSWVSNTLIKTETRMAVMEKIIEKDIPELKGRLDLLLTHQGLSYIPSPTKK